MAVPEPVESTALRRLIPGNLLPMLTQGDSVHAFLFKTDPDSGDFWGFSGYLVARGD